MKRRLWLEALGVAAALGGTAAVADAQTRKVAPAAKDWTRTVAMTPEGGFRMGNPNAAVKLVEYGSLTCPTCAHFSNSAKAPLSAHVRSGKVSFEFRNFVLNGLDATASLIARCAGPTGFFRVTETFYAAQPQWTAKVAGLSRAERDAIDAVPEGQRLGKVADVAGLTQLGAKAGVPPQRAKACLSDRPALDRLAQMHDAASALGVQGTPTFLINGKMVHAHDWAELQPLVRKAGG